MKTNKDKYVELAKKALWGALIGILGYQLFGFLLMFFPFLFMESSIEDGILPTTIAMVGSCLLVSLVTGLLPGLVLLGLYLPMVLIFNYAIKSNKNFWTVYLLMVIILLITNVSIVYGILSGVDLPSIDQLASEFMEGQRQVLSDQLAFTELEIKRFEDNFYNLLRLSLNLIPSGLIISTLFIVYLNYLLAGRRLLRNKILIVQPPIFPNLKIPRETLIIAGLFFALGIVVNSFEISIPFDIILNSIVVFGFIYFINGLATVSLFLHSFKLPGFVRIIIYLLILFIAILSIIVAILGFVDSLFDIRRPKGSDSSNG